MKPKYTKSELAWARRMAKKLGLKTPEEFLEMRFIEFQALAAAKDYDIRMQPLKVRKPRATKTDGANRRRKRAVAGSDGP